MTDGWRGSAGATIAVDLVVTLGGVVPSRSADGDEPEPGLHPRLDFRVDGESGLERFHDHRFAGPADPTPVTVRYRHAIVVGARSTVSEEDADNPVAPYPISPDR